MKPVIATLGRLAWLLIPSAIVVVLALGALSALLTLLDPVIRYPRERAESAAALRQAQIDLPAARERWRAAAISDFDVEIQHYIHPLCAPDLRVHVRAGSITAMEPVATGDAFVFPMIGSCDVTEWLPRAGFAAAENQIANINTDHALLHVEFDPVYGFVTVFSYVGIDNDGVYSVRLTHFQPVKP